MSRCNFCSWQRLKASGFRRATNVERKTLWDDEDNDDFAEAFGEGIVIVDKDGKFSCWFMELPSHCCC